MQNKNRVYDKDLRRFIYPQVNYERESRNGQCPPTYQIQKSQNFVQKKNFLNYQYNNMPAESYFANREANRNALGYHKDEGQLVQRNNNLPFSYMSKKYKPESKIYHYSISSKREYGNDIEEDTSSGRPINIDKKTYCIDSSTNRYKKLLAPRKEENILPTKVFVSESYPYNGKENNYKNRRSREKDGNKGGVINLNQKNRYNTQEALRNIILIQRWWKKYLYNDNNNKNNYERYTSVINRQSISRNNSYINNNQGNQFIVQTTRVEVFKRPYINKPIIKPEIITKENKVSFGSKNEEENLEIILDRDSLKQNMVNIWKEEVVASPNEQLCFIQNENFIRENLLRNGKMNKYEDEIRQLKLALAKKEKELNDLNNKLNNFLNKKELDKKLITRQLVDNLFINNNKNIIIPQTPSIEANENFEILSLEKEPLKMQLIDNLFIKKNNIEHLTNIISAIFSKEKTIIEARDNIEIIPLEKEPLKKQSIDNLFIKKTLSIKPKNSVQNIDKLTITIPYGLNSQNSIEANESIEIFPPQKEPLKKQSIDSLCIKKTLAIKPKNIFESIDNIEISFIEEKKTLEKQFVDDLFIEKEQINKPTNIIQNIDSLNIDEKQKPNNIISEEYYFELLPLDKIPLQKQFIDEIQFEETLKPENISQNIDKIIIYQIPKENNSIQPRDIIEICSIQTEPLQLQSVYELFIEKTPYMFKELAMEGFDGITVLKEEKPNLFYQEIDSFIIDSLEKKENEIQQNDLMTILKTPRPQNSIKPSDAIFIPSKEKYALQIQELDALFIENNIKKPENQIQTLDEIKLNEKIKSPNLIQQTNSINLLQKEKDALINQGLDSITIESIQKKENEINNLDALIIEGISYPINIIQSLDKIQLSKIQKNPNEISENVEIYIPSKEKPSLINENIDSVLIESMPKKENKIQSMEKIYIEPKKKPELIIQANDSIYIPKKARALNQNQNIDSITIESKEKKESIIQSLDKISLNSISRPDNIMQKSEDLFIESDKKDPYEFQSVDNLLIEGFSEEDNNKIQRIDQFTIIKVFKLSNRIDKMDTIYIPRQEKAQLNPQNVDSIYIEENSYQFDSNNKIQKMDMINIIKESKGKNEIIKNEEFILYPEEKMGVLIIQKLDQLMIEKEPKKYLLDHQGIDKIEIEGKKNEANANDNNYIQIQNENIEILSSKRVEENKETLVNSIFIEEMEKNNYEIETVEKIELLTKNKKSDELNKYNIEAQSYIYIPPKEKENEKDKLSTKLAESIFIENEEYPEKVPPIQEIETKESIYIPPKQKESLLNKNIDSILIEGFELQENVIENKDKINITLDKKFDEENNTISNEEKINIQGIINKEQKEKEIKNVIVDSILLEGKNIDENIQIEKKDDINLKEINRPDNAIEELDGILILPKEKDELKKQKCDELLIEVEPIFENEIQNAECLEILKEEKQFNYEIELIDSIHLRKNQKAPLKSETIDNILFEQIPIEEKKEQNSNIIIQDINIEIKPEKKILNLQNQLVDNLLIDVLENPQNSIQKLESVDILSTQKDFSSILYADAISLEIKPKPKSSKKPQSINLIEKNINLYIEPKEQKPLEYEVMDRMVIDGLTIPEYEIQEVLEFTFEKNDINKDLNIESIVNLMIKSKDKEPLQKQLTDSLFIEKTKIEEGSKIKPDNLTNLIDIEKNCNIYIEPLVIKKNLEKQKTDSLYIERIISAPSQILNLFSEEKCQKVETNSFNIINNKESKENKENKEENESKNLPCKKNAENEIQKAEEIFIESTKINEEYIIQLINRNNLDKNKINLPGKNIDKNKDNDKDKEIMLKPQIEFVQDRMDSLFFGGIIKKDDEIIEEEINNDDNKDVKVNEEKTKEEKKEQDDKKENKENIQEEKKENEYKEEAKEEQYMPIKEEMNEKEEINEKEEPKEKEEIKVKENEMEKLKGKHYKKDKDSVEQKDDKEEKKINKNEELKENEKEKENAEENQIEKEIIEQNEEEKNIKQDKDIKEQKPDSKEEIEEKDGDKIKKEEDKTELEDKEKLKQKPKMFTNLTENREKYFVIVQNINKVEKEKKEQKEKKEKKEKKEEKPGEVKIEEQNIINHVRTIMIENEELAQDKLNILCIEKWKKEKTPQKAIQFEIETKKETKKDNKFIPIIKDETQIKNIPLTKIQSDSLNLTGNTPPEHFQELILLKTKKNISFTEQIQPKSEINIHLPNTINASNKKEIITLSNLTSTKLESFKLEGSISPENYQELLQKKYLSNKSQIKPNSEIKLFLPKTIIPSSTSNTIKIKQEYSTDSKFQVSIKGKQKKPYIIENKGYFVINSVKSPSKNLIVRGTCFGFMAEPKKLGLVSQDFEASNPNLKSRWNLSNKNQRSQFFNIKGINNNLTWNNIIKRQKCVKFKIPATKNINNDLLSIENNHETLNSNKLYEQEIINEQEKIKKQKGIVKSTISKIHKEPESEENQEEFDPFSFCKKRDTTKYDNLFKERKTTSVKMKENNDINSNIVLKKNIKENKEEDEIKFRNNKERKSDINLIENKNKNKLKLFNKDNNKPKTLFKKKEKNMEYIRDSGGPKIFYS